MTREELARFISDRSSWDKVFSQLHAIAVVIAGIKLSIVVILKLPLNIDSRVPRVLICCACIVTPAVTLVRVLIGSWIENFSRSNPSFFPISINFLDVDSGTEIRTNATVVNPLV
jgi:hypothetical protein